MCERDWKKICVCEGERERERERERVLKREHSSIKISQTEWKEKV